MANGYRIMGKKGKWGEREGGKNLKRDLRHIHGVIFKSIYMLISICFIHCLYSPRREQKIGNKNSNLESSGSCINSV